MTPVSSQPIKVLFIDDDPIFSHLVENKLARFKDCQFDVKSFNTAQSALEEIKQNSQFDVILTDYNMAGLNGLDFCLQLNALDIQLPIIFLTSITDIKLAIESMKLGVEEFILKHDISGSVLPRAIVNVVESVRVRKYKQAVEKRLLLSEKQAQAIKELVVAVCHEFNNPLAAIKIGSDLVQRSSLSTEGLNLFKEFDNHFIKVQEAVNALRDLRVEKFNLNNGNTSESK